VSRSLMGDASNSNHHPSLPLGPLQLICEFASKVQWGSMPLEVRRAARRGVVDFIGVAMAGATSPAIKPFVDYVDAVYGRGRSSTLGLCGGTVAEGASFLNGVAGHMLDFDDVSDAMGGHPTVAVLPAALAVGEEVGAGHDEVLAAYVVGVEVVAALGRSLNKDHYERGWHPTATLGVFGATVAAARLLGLGSDGMREALSIATSFPSGIKGNFGTAMKPGQVGFGVSKGVLAARLSSLGVTASADAFERGHSFPNVYNYGGRNIEWKSLAELGETWNITSPGLWFKLYPCCGSTHAPIDAVLQLRRRQAVDFREVKDIDVYVHPRRLPHTDRPTPQSGLERKFSTQYVVAVAAVKGEVDLSDFKALDIGDDVRKRIDELLPKVHMRALPADEQVIVSGRTDCWAARVCVTDQLGREHWESVDVPVGSHPEFPVSDERLASKFLRNSSVLIGDDHAREALESLHSWMDGSGELRAVLGAHWRGTRQN
jgi:2-methylcitrate dehydratase PrpD